MAIDNWVNLNDVYVPANGGSVHGDLGIKGTLTIDDKTGNNTTYDVANEITALRDSVSQTNAAAIVLKAYPVGAIYISYYSTSPASLFGGTWLAITGRFPYFNAGTDTGGSNTHTLTEAEMPAHKHRLGLEYGNDWVDDSWNWSVSSSRMFTTDAEAGSAGGG